MAKHRSYNPSSEKSRGSSNELGRSSEVRGGSSDPRTCYCCGKVGHVKATCRFREAECRKCDKKGHTEAVCRRSTNPSGGVEQREFPGVAKNLAFTVWGEEEIVQRGVWVFDSGST